MATHIRTDEDIRADVLEELKWDTRVQSNEIGVAVKDGIVTLTGWVDSYLKKVAAEEAALRVPSVKAVANDIDVRLPAFPEARSTVAWAMSKLMAVSRRGAAQTRMLSENSGPPAASSE